MVKHKYTTCQECGYKYCQFAGVDKLCCWCFAKNNGYVIAPPCCFSNFKSDNPNEKEQFAIAQFITEPKDHPIRPDPPTDYLEDKFKGYKKLTKFI